jgi:hypothetical protein
MARLRKHVLGGCALLLLQLLLLLLLRVWTVML